LAKNQKIKEQSEMEQLEKSRKKKQENNLEKKREELHQLDR